jgi:hypothetical protein
MEAGRVTRIAEHGAGATDLDAGEHAIATLAHASAMTPAQLAPGDLAPVVSAYGVGGALEIVAVLALFHFVNRVADLVGIRSDLPLIQPHWHWLRRVGVRLQGAMMQRFIDLSNRPVDIDVAAALAEAAAVLGPLPDGYATLDQAPNVAAFLTAVARVVRQLDPAMLDRVSCVVADALPASDDDATGFHPRPADPLDALAFVGTRYAVRTTDAMVDAVRRQHGYGDAELTDLFYAIAMRNGLERMHRLLAAPPANTP